LRKKIFINADDFGLDYLTNARISYCLLNKLISSTTLIVNMPGFNDAVKRIHKHNLSGKIGIHFNLTEGRPLSKEMIDFLSGNTLDKLQLKHICDKSELNAIYKIP